MLKSLLNGCLLSMILMSVNIYSQELPKSLFPNQEIYDIDMLLKRAANLESEVTMDAPQITNQWSLQDVIDMALLNNLLLAQAKKDLESAQALYTGSIQDFYVPNLSTTVSAGFRDLFTTSKNKLDIAATSLGFNMDIAIPSIVLSKTIFNGFANLYAYRIAKENYLNIQNKIGRAHV